MLDPKNNWTGVGGVVADPEVINNSILKIRVAVDYAGSEKDSKNASGYFDVVYYLNNEDNARNAKWVKSQIDAGNIKKGSQLAILGRLVQERWEKDGNKGQRVVITAEALTYASSSKPQGESNSSSAGTSSVASLPDDF